MHEVSAWGRGRAACPETPAPISRLGLADHPCLLTFHFFEAQLCRESLQNEFIYLRYDDNI